MASMPGRFSQFISPRSDVLNARQNGKIASSHVRSNIAEIFPRVDKTVDKKLRGFLHVHCNAFRSPADAVNQSGPNVKPVYQP
jgi:hypothetical protein